MEATIKIKASELNDHLFRKIKNLFEGKSVTITISSEADETEYLLRDKANEEFLLSSMAEEPNVTFSVEDFEKRVKEMLKSDH